MKNNKWTDEQVLELKKLYGRYSAADCAKHFGKSESAVRSKVHYLRKRGWTFDTKRDIKVRKTKVKLLLAPPSQCLNRKKIRLIQKQ